MNTPANQSNRPEDIELRMRTLRTLWLALLMSVFFYYMLTLFLGQSANATPNNTLSLALIVVAISITAISFLIKNKLINRAVEQQQLPMVQQAYILTWAINEVPALLGLFDFFRTGNRYYYVLILLAVAGQLLNYPRREHVENAAFKRTTF
jgi:hypothetical protein